MDTLGAEIRERRLARGLSMGQLAQASGISRGYLNNVEKGRTLASASVLGRIARALGIAPEPLVARAVEARVSRVLARVGRENAGERPEARRLTPGDRMFLQWFLGLPTDRRRDWLARFGPDAPWLGSPKAQP